MILASARDLQATSSRRMSPSGVSLSRNPALEAARDVASDICRGLMLPRDVPAYAAADPVSACTELMALLTMVIFLLPPCAVFFLYAFFL